MNLDLFDSDSPKLEHALGLLTVEALKKLAALTGNRAPSRKDDLVTLIVNHLAGERLRTVFQGLNELQRAAVAETVHSLSPQFPESQFRAKYGCDPDWGSGGEYTYAHKPSALCLFFYKDRLMPADLKARLLAFVPPPREASLTAIDPLPAFFELADTKWNEALRISEKVTEQVPIAVHETERAAQRELISILRLVDAGKVAVSDKTRKPSASTIDAITAILDRGDYYPHVPVENKWDDENAGPIRAFAWPLLIQAGGLAQLSGAKLQLTKAGRKALSEPAPATIRTLWNKWMNTTLFDELARIDCVKGQTGKGRRGLTAVSSRREVIEDCLAECPPGGWIDADNFYQYMQATGNEFEVTRDPWALYLGELQYGSFGYEGSAGFLSERYVLSLLLEYAATLGIIDVALIPPSGARDNFRDLWGSDELPFFSRYDGLMYFRLTPLGAFCLDLEPVYQTAPLEVRTVFRVLPNLEIASTGSDLEPSDRLALNAYAVPVSDSVWRLDPSALLAAIEAGKQMQEIREFLTARNGGALPDAVTLLLDDVEGRATQVHDRGLARLVECADSALAAHIANDSRTRKHCMRAGERHLVVPASSEAAFRRALQSAGYLLAEEAHRPVQRKTAKPPAVAVDD